MVWPMTSRPSSQGFHPLGLNLDHRRPNGPFLFDEIGDKVATALFAALAVLRVTVWGHVAGNADEARRLLEECYQGAWESLEAYAEDLLESTGELDQVPEHLRSYVDVEAYVRDLELNGDVFTVEDGTKLHVFWGR
jgi:antirestriction protein